MTQSDARGVRLLPRQRELRDRARTTSTCRKSRDKRMRASATCRRATSEFDASVKGAHTVATRSQQLPGVEFAIVRRGQCQAGAEAVSVTFTVKDKAGNLLDISEDRLPEPGDDRSDHGLQRLCLRRRAEGDDRRAASTSTRSTPRCPIRPRARYAVGIEGYRNVTINPGTVWRRRSATSASTRCFYFAIGDAKVTPRRQVVSQEKCNTCHNKLMLHGGNRQSVEYCVVCHNPGVTDISQRESRATRRSRST